ncbi:MAG TPA: beta-ketoacyl-[acyl-carrier-protein] synthase family protein [Candidatus Limnocylindrales bacterium]|nr:beta-ketoacyl-[acyl-carrier-protein] synthase family protein [Candidatus Limnocylindrales bacterium]
MITGIGLICSAGSSTEALWEALTAGRSAVRAVTRFDASGFRSRVAAEVDDFEPLDHMDQRTARQLDRFSQFGLAAGRQAVADAGFEAGRSARAERTAVYIGSALGGIAFAEEQHARYLGRGIRAVAPTLALAVFGGAAPANLGIALGLHGPILSTANSCAAGAVAIGEAVRLIRGGGADAALAGGVETPLSPLAFGAFDIIRALSARHNDAPRSASRPFDRERDGFVMGEAACLLVLEEAGAAQRRGARIYAEIAGYAATSDAHHMVQPRPDGRQAARAVRLALADAGTKAAQVDHVNAHASSTPLGDRAEAAALRLALRDHLERITVSGTKGAYGHPLGASGAIEAAVCALAIQRGEAPGTVNLRHVEPGIAAALPRLLAAPAAGTVRTVLSTSFGFGGLNAALVLRAPEAG